jgi:uncharacterized membrane protein
MPSQGARFVPGAAEILRRVGWWSLLVICVTFGGFALWLGVVEIFALAGVVNDAKARAAPVVFVVHAVTGGVVLIAGALQFNPRLRAARRRLHRLAGRVYVGAVWIASLSGLWSALFFSVDLPVRINFVVVAALWFTTTTVAFQQIRRGRVAVHREWMIRSFTLSLFFVTFEPWVTGLESAGLPHAVAYPAGLFLGWFVNLIVAEWWIHRSRHREPVPGLAGVA